MRCTGEGPCTGSGGRIRTFDLADATFEREE